MKKPLSTAQRKAKLISHIRAGSFSIIGDILKEVKARDRVEEGEFTIKKEKDRCRVRNKCAHCGGIFREQEVERDHIEPMVPVTGWDSWDGYINRWMNCGPEGIQTLCKACHKVKSDAEKVERARNKKLAKNKGL